MPARVVFAEVNAANVRGAIVDHDQFLVVATQQAPRRSAVSIRKLNLHTRVAECLGHRLRCTGFGAQVPIEIVGG